MPPKPLDYESINENVKKSQYAVRGELYLRASELQKEGKKVEYHFFSRFYMQKVIFVWFVPWLEEKIGHDHYILFMELVLYLALSRT